MSVIKVEGTFTGTGTTDAPDPGGKPFRLFLGFGSGSVDLEVSYDDGSTWYVVKTYATTSSEVVDEMEVGVVWRLNCTSYVSDIYYRISR